MVLCLWFNFDICLVILRVIKSLTEIGVKMLSSLQQYVDKYAVDYQSNIPYPHIVIDDFIKDDKLMDAIVAEYEQFDDLNRFNNTLEDKYYCDVSEKFPPSTKALFNFFNSEVFTAFLEDLTGIQDIIANKDASGGGMHVIKDGGKLGIHIDFNKKHGLERRLNVLLFLNKEWKPEYGGHLELWSIDDEGKLKSHKKVSPHFNRIAIFNTSETSFHGHPNPLTCPNDVSRKSMASYFFTEADNEDNAHGTIFV